MKIFISYSWTPEKNKRKVIALAQKLSANKIEVVIDETHLRAGYDKYAFMERIANDSTIDKVLIICNKDYSEKADKRVGGVGDESMIITSEIYGKTEQTKFIPIVFERDSNGKPFLPTYAKSLVYIDFSSARNYDKSYYKLLKELRTDIFDRICSCLKSESIEYISALGEIRLTIKLKNDLFNEFVLLISDDGRILVFQPIIGKVPESELNKIDIPRINELDFGEFYFEPDSEDEEYTNLFYTFELENENNLVEIITPFLSWLKNQYNVKLIKFLEETFSAPINEIAGNNK